MRIIKNAIKSLLNYSNDSIYAINHVEIKGFNKDISKIATDSLVNKCMLNINSNN